MWVEAYSIVGLLVSDVTQLPLGCVYIRKAVEDLRRILSALETQDHLRLFVTPCVIGEAKFQVCDLGVHVKLFLLIEEGGRVLGLAEHVGHHLRKVSYLVVGHACKYQSLNALVGEQDTNA